MLIYKPPQSLFIIGQATMETQTLLGLSEPLQQDMNSGVKFLSLQQDDTLTRLERATFPSVQRLQEPLGYLAEGLLQTRLLGHGEVAHRLPASAQLLHLDFHPGGVVVAALDQIPR